MPNRIIKESLCDSEKIAALSDFEFRLWVGLITQADDAGRGDARPAIIKGRVFPFRERLSIKDIDAALQELAAKCCVSLYTVDGRPYFLFPGWVKHQRIRDCKPKFPEPSENTALQQSAASCGNPPQVAAICGELPQSAALIQSESESESNPNPKESAPARYAHGQYQWVKLTGEEYSRLLADLGEAELARCIAYVDEAAQSTGNKNKWKDWNLTLRKCHRDGWGLDRRANRSASAPRDYSSLKNSFSSLDDIAKSI